MKLNNFFLKYREYTVTFLKKYGFVLLGAGTGAFAGVWGSAAGFASGLFVTFISMRIRDEKEWRKAVEQGNSSGIHGEPFPGALYICALTVNCLGDSAEAARLIKKMFGKEFHADWNSLCRSAAAARQLNGDLLVECLANIIRKRENQFSSVMIRSIFTLLESAEFSWDKKQETEKPSRYLAELLDYKYISDALSTAYDVLGLESGATIEQVRAAHRRLAAKYHPDIRMSDSDAFMRVQAAYELILHQQ
jgi:hypothetical protein